MRGSWRARPIPTSAFLLIIAAALSCGGDDPVMEPSTTGGWGIGFGDDQFALIEAGSFEMGDSTSGNSDERPVHTVNITRDFYLQKTEVTQAQWESVMGTNPSHFSSFCGETCPVESVSWNDIQVFIDSLNVRFPDRNFRLPTEAEWEYAGRAGTTGDYGGTGELGEMGWYSGNSLRGTHPVAQKLANDWGLYDMHGNVFECVQDWYDSGYYSVSPTDDPQGPSSGWAGWARVERGGSWITDADFARSASRTAGCGAGGLATGFRLARTP